MVSGVEQWLADAEVTWDAIPKHGAWSQVHPGSSVFDGDGFAAEFSTDEDAEWAIAMRDDWPRALRLLKAYRVALKEILRVHDGFDIAVRALAESGLAITNKGDT